MTLWIGLYMCRTIPGDLLALMAVLIPLLYSCLYYASRHIFFNLKPKDNVDITPSGFATTVHSLGTFIPRIQSKLLSSQPYQGLSWSSPSWSPLPFCPPHLLRAPQNTVCPLLWQLLFLFSHYSGLRPLPVLSLPFYNSLEISPFLPSSLYFCHMLQDHHPKYWWSVVSYLSPLKSKKGGPDSVHPSIPNTVKGWAYVRLTINICWVDGWPAFKIS